MTEMAPDMASHEGSANGAGMADTEMPTAEKSMIRPSERRQARMAQAFSSVVGVLMRDPGFRNLRLMDLEWLVLPPVMSGQWRLAQAKAQTLKGKPGTAESDMMVPVAVALWATVSPEIDKRLSENLDKPLLLRTHEWASGNIPWLIALAGDKRAIPTFLKQLMDSEFKDKTLKMRASGPDGKVMVRTLGLPEPKSE
jgi:hemolysin-activating ACP:hemolysin acyltransferase